MASFSACANVNGINLLNEGSGLSTIPSQAREYCVGADVDMNGLAIVGSKAKESKKEVKAWLEGKSLFWMKTK